MITIIYAGLLGLIYVLLSAFVVKGRYSKKMAFGDGGDPEMTKRIRMHGNFAEYVPLGLILLYLVDACQYAGWLVHLLGIMLLVGRVLHAIAIHQAIFRFRVVGMVLTLLMLLISSLLLIWHFIALQLTGF